MTNDNFKPTLPFIPKTETRIFLGGRPIDQQVEQSSFKGVSKQHYQSIRATINDPSYGPGFWEDLGKVVTSTALAVSYVTPIAPITMTATVVAGGAGLLMRESSNQQTREQGNTILEVVTGAGEAHLSGVGEIASQGASLAQTHQRINSKK